MSARMDVKESLILYLILAVLPPIYIWAVE